MINNYRYRRARNLIAIAIYDTLRECGGYDIHIYRKLDFKWEENFPTGWAYSCEWGQPSKEMIEDYGRNPRTAFMKAIEERLGFCVDPKEWRDWGRWEEIIFVEEDYERR